MNTTIIFFITSLVVFYLLLKRQTPLNSQLDALCGFLRKKVFPGYSESEHLKFSLLRIIFGLILVSRSFEINTYLGTVDFYSVVGLLSALYLAATIFLTIGLFTQYILIFLTFFMWQAGDRLLGTSTLANDVAAMLAVLLFVTSSGKYLSIDSILIPKYRPIERVLLYARNDVSQDTIALAKLAALVSFWALCVYSVSMHLNESAWMTGVAGPLLLTNNFMSPWHSFFESVFISNEPATHVARYLLWLMMFWYPSILPLTLLGGIWRTYVILWGLLFFTFSLTLLSLGSLAEIEFVFWAAIFWSKSGIDNKQKLLIFYDDKCNLCDNLIRFICVLDIFSKIELKPASINQLELEKLGITEEEALTDLYGFDKSTKTLKDGYDFYLLLSQKIVLLWPIVPILYIGKLFNVGGKIYSYIAVRRRRLFGVCTLPTHKKSYAVNLSSKNQHVFYNSISIHVIFLAFCYLISIPAPYIGVTGSNNFSSQSAHFYGIAPINVFNKTDLRMAENWFTITSNEFNELVPIFTPEGERLEMHKSDRIYFGITIGFRRGEIGHTNCAFNSRANTYVYLADVYLRKKQAPKGTYTFRYNQYHQALPSMSKIELGTYEKNPVKPRCDVEFEVETT